MAYAFMASSSQKTPLEEEEKDRDWLELGLGFGAACGKPQHQEEEEECANVLPNPFPVPSVVSVPPSSALQLQAQRQTELCLGLGLGLGLNNDDHRVIDHHVAVPFSNYHRPWKNQDYHNDHDLASRPSSGGFPGLHDDWQLQVPNNLHDNHSTSGRCRPHPAGLWFSLQSYTNQKGDKLPQIPKAYIRVKNENLTVLMVKKYLVTKLGLSNEAEIEISCMGQKLLHTQTLKQVRDTVWLPKLVESVNSTSTIHHSSLHQQTSVNHLMSLHYARPCVSD